jgi:sugar O-acyltransferase (sialic acid O-acetyltransferase NeuD family)
MPKGLLIYGAGGLGREVLSMLKAMPEWNPVGFIDDKQQKNSRVGGVDVLGDMEFLNSLTESVNMIIAVGNPNTKKKIIGLIKNPRIQFVSLIHPSVIIQNPDTVVIGKGSIICAGSIFTTDISIGDHVLVNLKTTIGHNVVVGDYTSIMPSVNLAGDVKVGECVLLGTASSIINNIEIGPNTIVGMGSVVIRNVGPGKKIAGVPAQEI